MYWNKLLHPTVLHGCALYADKTVWSGIVLIGMIIIRSFQRTNDYTDYFRKSATCHETEILKVYNIDKLQPS